MANIDDLITASTFNAIRSKVNKVLGVGDGAEFGYGQTLASSIVADNQLITAANMRNLFLDIELAGKHQTGNPPQWTTLANGLNAPDAGEIIGIYASDIGASGTTLDATTDLNEGYLDFQQAAAQIETNNFLTGVGALSTTIAKESTRTSAWNTSINHTVTITWTSAEARRTWANAGGKIVFNASLTGGTSVPSTITATPPGTKDEIWQSMLSTMGTISMGVQGTTTTGNGTANALASILYTNRNPAIRSSWSNTDSSNTIEIFNKSGTGIYSENKYRILAWQVASNSLRFNIVFEDAALGNPNIDENVTGTVVSSVSLITPNGFLTHSVPSSSTDSQL